MMDIIFVASLLFGFISVVLFTSWCENQIGKKQQ
jgi:hypothetical protein